MKKVCLIGYGKWGQKIYKKTNKIFDYKYVLRKKNSLKKKYLDNVDWVIVASPNKTHFKIVKKCLLNKKNVFCEKPLALNLKDTKILYQLAMKNKVDLVVSDFSGVEKWLKPYINSSRSILGKNGEPGNIRELVRRNGTKVEEKLLEVGIFNKYIKYTYSGGLPLTSDYFSEILLEELNENSTKVIWKASFKRLHYWTKKPPIGQEDHILIDKLSNVYQVGLNQLKNYIEKNGKNN